MNAVVALVDAQYGLSFLRGMFATVNPSVTGDDFPIVELTDADGTAVRLEPDGRPMVVNLWYSTCGPCARELQYFAAVDAEFGDQVRFVGVDPLDDVDKMLEFAAARGVDYELLRDDYTLVDALGTVYFPMTVFVSADGRIVAQTGELTDTELRHHIDELLDR